MGAVNPYTGEAMFELYGKDKSGGAGSQGGTRGAGSQGGMFDPETLNYLAGLQKSGTPQGISTNQMNALQSFAQLGGSTQRNF